MYIYTWSIYPSFLSIYKFAVKITSWCDVNMAHKSKYKNRQQQQQHHHHIEQMERIYNIQHTRKKIIIKRYKKFFFYWEKSNAHNVKKKKRKFSICRLFHYMNWIHDTPCLCVCGVCVGNSWIHLASIELKFFESKINKSILLFVKILFYNFWEIYCG